MPALALIGDSHAEVLFPLLKPLAEAAGYRVVYSIAKRGWSEASYNRDASFASAIAAARPDVALVHLGGNNQAMSTAAYSRDVQTLLGTLERAGVKRVLWVGPYAATSDTANTRVRHETTADLQATILPQFGVSWLDTRPFSRTGHTDGVHFSRTAYADFARRIGSFLGSSAAVVASGPSRVWIWAATAVSLVGIAIAIARRR
jgi:lysophospholipase L1-like esterase